MHHLTSILLHALSAALLFLLLRRMPARLGRSALRCADLRAAPAACRSVAWIAERKDVLSGLFWWLTLTLCVCPIRRSAGRRTMPWRWWPSAGTDGEAMIVTLPAVALLLDFWPLRRGITRTEILEKVPLLVLAAAGSASLTTWRNRAGERCSPPRRSPLLMRAANALVS